MRKERVMSVSLYLTGDSQGVAQRWSSQHNLSYCAFPVRNKTGKANSSKLNICWIPTRSVLVRVHTKNCRNGFPFVCALSCRTGSGQTKFQHALSFGEISPQPQKSSHCVCSSYSLWKQSGYQRCWNVVDSRAFANEESDAAYWLNAANCFPLHCPLFLLLSSCCQ